MSTLTEHLEQAIDGVKVAIEKRDAWAIDSEINNNLETALALLLRHYQMEEENERLREALRKNIKYCQYYDGNKCCGEIAVWAVFDYDGWEEYYCEKHKDTKTCENDIDKQPNLVLAEQVLKESKDG